ncbi:MAG TPA: MlaD family protein [Bryobacteraceae bacterium]|nr:MlaD family protein [Bryobacteraceae bacterium]
MTRALRLGLFVVGTLLILGLAVFLIGSNELLFQPNYHLKAQFANVSGLTPGADVRVGGIHEGTIKGIQLPNQPNGQVTLVMELDDRTHRVVKKDSMAAIKSDGLMGDKYVEISFGTEGAGDVKDGDTIASQPPLDISDLIKKADQILDSSKGAVENISQASDSLKDIGAKVNQGKGTIGALINDKKAYQEVTAGATAFDEDMEALKHNFFLRGFFKKRGYEDADELKKNEIPRLPMAPAMKTFTYDGARMFDKPDTAKMKNQKTFNEVGRFLEDHKFGMAVVAVSAGTTGDSDQDRQLSQARSYVVREYLAKNFRFDDRRLKTIGLGKALSPEESDKVEVVVYPAVIASNRQQINHLASNQ